jgi:hypothetical protein
MAGIPEILIFLAVIGLVCAFIAFVHAWLSKDSPETGAGENRDRAATEDEPGRREDGAARHGYLGKPNSGTVGANR